MLRRYGAWIGCIILLVACSRQVPPTPTPAPAPEYAATAVPSPQVESAIPASQQTDVPSPTPTSEPSPTPTRAAMPIPTPAGPPTDVYVVEPGDTLIGIALYECDCDVEELMALNRIKDPASLQVGQQLLIPVKADRIGPATRLLPDSEVVYSPAYLDFDVEAFVREHGGYLASYSEVVNGKLLSGAQIVQKVAREFSVGPRLLLALLEYQSGWLSGVPADQTHEYFPVSLGRGKRAGLFFDLGWAANRVNEGYYGYKRSGRLAFTFSDRSRAVSAERLNAGTVGVQNVLAYTCSWEMWHRALGAEGFMRTYVALFGDPEVRAIEPLVPADLTQPSLALPWQGGTTWYLSSGPHGAWFDGSAWAALDFAPSDVMGHCGVSGQWATAAAPGRVLRSEEGQVLLDLDGDGHEQTGWVLFYLHVVPAEGIKPGLQLKQGDPIGHPSCEGGLADSSHLHIARRYNGEWMAADGPVPLVFSGWQAVNGLAAYDGKLVKGSEERQACECWDDQVNGILSDNLPVR